MDTRHFNRSMEAMDKPFTDWKRIAFLALVFGMLPIQSPGFAALQALGRIPGVEATEAIRGAAEGGDIKERPLARGLLQNRPAGDR